MAQLLRRHMPLCGYLADPSCEYGTLTPCGLSCRNNGSCLESWVCLPYCCAAGFALADFCACHLLPYRFALSLAHLLCFVAPFAAWMAEAHLGSVSA